MPKVAATAVPPLPCTSNKVRQLMRRVSQHYDREVAASGLKTSQYSLLSTASRAGPIRSVELAARLKTTPSTLSRNLRLLVDAGYLELQSGGDARSHLVVVTPAGDAKIAEARQLWKAAQSSLQATLGIERVQALHALVDEALELLGPHGR